MAAPGFIFLSLSLPVLVILNWVIQKQQDVLLTVLEVR